MLLTSAVTIMPLALATMVEHIGGICAISSTCERNFLQDPGLHRTLLGDGMATSLAALFGSSSQHHLRREYRRAGPVPGL